MIRAGVPERQRLAFTAELATIEAQLHQQQAVTVEQLPLSEDGARDEEPTVDHQSLTTDHQPALSVSKGPPACPERVERTTNPHIQIARPEDLHPALSDAQLSAVLRDALSDTLTNTGRSVLERVSWRLNGDGVQLICAARDLAPVTGQLLAGTRRALADLGLLSIVQVQIGRPEPVGVRPEWIDAVLWARVPVWAHGSLVGSVVVDGRLYGATPARTAGLVGLAGQGEVIAWVLEQVGGIV